MAIKAAERENKRSPLNMRTTAKLRDALENEASKADRSLAQEVEHRLEKSFQEDDLLAVFVGNRTHVQLLVRVLSATIRRIEDFRGDRYVDSYATAWHVQNGINTVLETLLGPDFGEPKPDEGGEWTEDQKKKLIGLAPRIAIETLKDFGLVTSFPTNIKTTEKAVHAYRAAKSQKRPDTE
ncbi:hypothetical protein MKK63_21060 [Methylobacterium sp. J-088]|uniref:hypothetical protein n=1 Tax=Methylobacterium sp. J-088 TaxID=2836664 RepID=UPI001FB92688|nr:hypothetical protein [Methylobacterium sp. J-088]MCJ2065184.1 hypothetical protein [Methylobacterium sp. J-088]